MGVTEMETLMLKSIESAVRAISHTDSSITEEQIKAALDALNGKRAGELAGEPLHPACTRKQVAKLMGVTDKTVTGYAKRGLLVPIYTGAGGKRAQAYTGESVAALLSGKLTTAMTMH